MSAKIFHRKAASNTGLVGITETQRRGKTCFTVSWRPKARVRKTTTVYFGGESVFRRADALLVAKTIRRSQIQQRLEREEARR